MTRRPHSDALHIRRPVEKMELFKKNRNDKPKLPYSEAFGRNWKRYPPRPNVEPMHQGHWATVDDYVDIADQIEDKHRQTET